MPKVFLGMSGGVDSSVSAILLKEQGYDVTGVYMKNWSKDLPGMKCPWAEDLADAKRVAVQLDLDFEVWDFEADYKQKVVDYMLAEFQKGRTPNPDVICNELIKFKLFYDQAMARGADFIATGHYARTSTGYLANPRTSSTPALHYGKAQASDYSPPQSSHGAVSGDCPYPQLLRAVDENKDQTYFLYRMSDAATAHTLFPVGGMYKPEVKKLAAEKGLDVAHKKESMGVCFVGEVGMKDFLREYLDTQPGEIRERETDRILGYHDGAVFYTIGQRHGLYLGGGLPYYVVAKDLAQNIVYVSKNLNSTELWAHELNLEDIHWRAGALEILANASDVKVQVRLRHRAPLLEATLVLPSGQPVSSQPSIANPSATLPDLKKKSDKPAPHSGEKLDGSAAPHLAKLVFAEPVKRPAAGQSAVLYQGDCCLGGAFIA